MCLAKQQQQDVLWTNLTVKMQQFLGTSILAPMDLASICLVLAASLTQSPGQAGQARGAAIGQARLLECVHGLLVHSSQALEEQALEQGEDSCANELLEVQQQINSIQGQVTMQQESPLAKTSFWLCFKGTTIHLPSSVYAGPCNASCCTCPCLLDVWDSVSCLKVPTGLSCRSCCA